MGHLVYYLHLLSTFAILREGLRASIRQEGFLREMGMFLPEFSRSFQRFSSEISFFPESKFQSERNCNF